MIETIVSTCKDFATAIFSNWKLIAAVIGLLVVLLVIALVYKKQRDTDRKMKRLQLIAEHQVSKDELRNAVVHELRTDPRYVQTMYSVANQALQTIIHPHPHLQPPMHQYNSQQQPMQSVKIQEHVEEGSQHAEDTNNEHLALAVEHQQQQHQGQTVERHIEHIDTLNEQPTNGGVEEEEDDDDGIVLKGIDEE